MRRKLLPILAFPLLFTLASGSSAQLTEYNYNQAISAMMSADTRAPKARAVKHVPSVTVVRLRQIVVFTSPGEEPDVPSIEISAAKNYQRIAKMRAALQANPAIRAALAAKGVPLSRIVGVDIFSDGALRVYIL